MPLALGVAASPALACDWNKEAKTETQIIVTEQPTGDATAQQEAPKPTPAQRVEDGGTVVADGAALAGNSGETSNTVRKQFH